MRDKDMGFLLTVAVVMAGCLIFAHSRQRKREEALRMEKLHEDNNRIYASLRRMSPPTPKQPSTSSYKQRTDDDSYNPSRTSDSAAIMDSSSYDSGSSYDGGGCDSGGGSDGGCGGSD